MVLTTVSTFLVVLVGYCAVYSVYCSEQKVEVSRKICFYPQVKKSDASTLV